MKKHLLALAIVTFSSLFLFGCGKKTTTVKTNPEPVEETFVMPETEIPNITLTSRADGHELKMILQNIPTYIENLEYELIYLAKDEGIEIEKGIGDSIKLTENKLERDILLGTASCTNGCKYKYDVGVNGGSLNLTFFNKEGQAFLLEKPFTLTQDKKTKKFIVTFTAK